MIWLTLLIFSSSGPIGDDSLISLPVPDTTGKVTVEQALLHRRSVRSYANEPLTLEDIGQLLWAAQGKTDKVFGRTAPSAGATYPMELFLVVGRVTGLDPGIYHYQVERHALKPLMIGDRRRELARAAFGQSCVEQAPANLVLACDYKRTTRRYGERGFRYVHMEAGHIGENVALQAVARGLGTVMVGAFNDSGVQRILQTAYSPLYIIPVGKIKIKQ